MNELVKNRIFEISTLCESCKVDKLWIFGSANTLAFNEKSDFDFLVSFENMDVVEYAENYFLLIEKLEKLLKRDVDLVTVNSLSNPYFIKAVEESKSLIYDQQNQKIPV
jgi:predicted nucleotidyltransferase